MGLGAFPGDECLGVIPAQNEKNCNLNFDNQYPFFYLYLIRSEQPGQEDLYRTLKWPMLGSALSANMELAISYDEDK